MLITPPALNALFTGFQTAYQQGFAGVQPQWNLVAMEAPSTTASETYGWMKDIPGFREWVGQRVVHNLEAAGYTITNLPWELTIGVDRDAIEDDKFGIFTPLFSEMGRQTASFPDTKVFPLLKAGFNTACYDGQYFFDTDHPVIAKDGSTVSVSNVQSGSGDPWFLMDLSRMIKPMVYQKRRPFTFTRMDAPTSEVVFRQKKYEYGVDGRANVGFGFWQLAFGSKADLTHDNYSAARAAMQSFKRDHGDPLGVNPTHLVVPPSLEGKARQVVENQRKANGEDNEWKGTAKLVVVPWLA
ncbi:hypothetical protein A6A40_17300 (plasmid) [Azospirillum humicireducens]|uniref:Bacteriophage Mu GpT domain-containing protein n=1 Tax=Azospirillum humicireducens TaxID=1226968 RepID=A0A2R4VQT3_9PROT|nr:Mu-like prophage major head subunit gpT family protein [Azospirillum humicireducens]AWB06808.1 hypothetical protein A6A40_17300 [Azospirillum humicireducens]